MVTPHRSSWQVLRRLWPFLRAYRRWMVVVIIAAIVGSAGLLLMGRLLAWLIDITITSGGDRELLTLAGILLGASWVLAAASYLRVTFISRLGEHVVADIRVRAFASLLHREVAFFDDAHSVSLISRLTADTAVVQTIVGTSISLLVRNALLVMGGLVMLLLTSPFLTGLAVVVIPAVAIPLLAFAGRVRRLSRESQDRIADFAARAGEALGAIRLVKAFAREDFEQKEFTDAVSRAVAAAQRRIAARAALTSGVIGLVFSAVVFLLWSGGQQVLAGDLSTGSLVAFIFYAAITGGAAAVVSETIGEIQRGLGALERLFDLIDQPMRPAPAQALPTGAIEFEGVSFAYPHRPAAGALHEVSFAAAAGETVAIVGASGAGKSTILQLVLGFYPPDVGRVLHDGRLVCPSDRQAIGWAPQDVMLFSGTVADNIRFGRAASDEKVTQAARAAYADDFIRRLPQGYETELGERGAQLSGGQRQRLSLARAILFDPPILLLDEVTSALDGQSREMVERALDALMPGRTVLVVAHRLRAAMRADRVLLLDQGRLVAEGPHEVLLAAGGLYRQVVKAQLAPSEEIVENTKK
ncbi:MAG: ABC transporter ATP-binding protein [Pseudomonadota bacterium]